MSDLAFLGQGPQAGAAQPVPQGAPPPQGATQGLPGNPGQAIGLEAALRVLRDEVGWTDDVIAQVISDLISYMGQQVSPEQQQQIQQAVSSQGAEGGQLPQSPTDFLRGA